MEAEAVATIGVYSSSASYISPQDQDVLNKSQNIYEAKIDKKLSINTSSNDNQGKGISQFKCVKCRHGFSRIDSAIRHLKHIHGQTGSFKNDIERVYDIKPELKSSCPKCNTFLKRSNSLRVHFKRTHMMYSSFKGEILQYTQDCTGEIQMYSVVINNDKCSYYPTRSYPDLVTFKKHEEKYNEVSLHTRNNNGQTINVKERDIKIQDNNNATNTTTNNMDSNRKRSHSPAIHEEESNAKKSRLNPSESGYPQSALSNDISDQELLSCRDYIDELINSNPDNKSLLNSTVNNKDFINADVQSSATSDSIDNGLFELAQKTMETNDAEILKLMENDPDFAATVKFIIASNN